MKLRIWTLGIAGALFSLSGGCAYFSKAASVQSAVVADGMPDTAGRVAIPSFIQEKYKGGRGTERWPDAPLTDRFATGLLQRGYLLVDRAVVRKTLKDNGLSWEDIHREDVWAQIGRLLKADVVILGKLTLVELPDGTVQSRKVTVRGIRVSDGRVVLSMSAVDDTMYRSLSGEILIDQGLADMFATSESVEGGVKTGAVTGGGDDVLLSSDGAAEPAVDNTTVAPDETRSLGAGGAADAQVGGVSESESGDAEGGAEGGEGASSPSPGAGLSADPDGTSGDESPDTGPSSQ